MLMSISKFPSETVVPVQLTQWHRSVPIIFQSPYLTRKNQDQNFIKFESLDLVHFLSHGPASICLTTPISLKPLSQQILLLRLCSCCGHRHLGTPPCLSYLIKDSVSYHPSLLTISHFHYFSSSSVANNPSLGSYFLLPDLPTSDLSYLQSSLNLSPHSSL